MRRFEALANLGSYRFGNTYTFIKVPQVVLNAVRVGLMRELPALSEGQVASLPETIVKPHSSKRSRRKTVDAQDISTFVAEIQAEDDGQPG